MNKKGLAIRQLVGMLIILLVLGLIIVFIIRNFHTLKDFILKLLDIV